MLLQKLRLNIWPLKQKLLQGDERKLKDGVVFLTVHDVGATYQVDQNDRFDISFFDISLSELGDFLER